MKKLVIGAVAVACTVSGQANEIQCKHGKILIAGCSFEGRERKTVSFCLSPKEQVIHYRYGNVARPELAVDFSEGQKLYRWLDRVTHVTFLGFNREGYSYVFGIP